MKKAKMEEEEMRIELMERKKGIHPECELAEYKRGIDYFKNKLFGFDITFRDYGWGSEWMLKNHFLFYPKLY